MPPIHNSHSADNNDPMMDDEDDRNNFDLDERGTIESNQKSEII